MRFAMLGLLSLLVLFSHAASEPNPVKVFFLKDGPISNINQVARDIVEAENSTEVGRQTDDVENYHDDYSNNRNTIAKASDSNARFFIRRFMRLKNPFGTKTQPIIIQLILNGTNAVPVTPVTPTVPAIPTNPTLPTLTDVPTIPTDPALPTVRSPSDDLEGIDDDKTSLEIPARVSYKHKAAKKKNEIIVRIPAKYKHLFNNGQQIKISSSKNGVNRRSAINRRGNMNQNSNAPMRMKSKKKSSRTSPVYN